MADGDMPRARFHSMCDGTKEDWDRISQAMKPFIVELPDRVLAHLKMLQGDCGGFAIDRLEHCLQTATRAHRDGRDEEYVVCALLHDMGDILGPRNHADVAAAILKPFVSEKLHWMCANHGVFQGYYFFHYLGLDRNLRDGLRGNPHFEDTARFCELYDQTAFDSSYDSAPLSFFEPMVRRTFAKPINSIYLGVAESG